MGKIKGNIYKLISTVAGTQQMVVIIIFFYTQMLMLKQKFQTFLANQKISVKP